MKFIYSVGLFLATTCVPFLSFSQSKDSVLRDLIKVDGTIKTKFEVSTSGGLMRFNVRNSRIGFRGDIGEYLCYRIQIELCAEGSFAPLDLYGTLKPSKALSINFGQTAIPFENLYIITPSDMMFANRAFIGKYFTPGGRDIGAMLQYKFHVGSFPMEGQGGVFNGGRINNPQWTDQPSYAFRLIAGDMDGFRTSVKVYRFQSELLDLFFWGADVHYANKRFCAEAEVMSRKSFPFDNELFGTYLQGSYMFDFHVLKMFQAVSPAVRWDAMGYEVLDRGFDVNRLTFGLNFALAFKPFKSALRLDYEQYFVRDVNFPEFSRDIHLADNKFTVELMLKF